MVGVVCRIYLRSATFATSLTAFSCLPVGPEIEAQRVGLGPGFAFRHVGSPVLLDRELYAARRRLKMPKCSADILLEGLTMSAETMSGEECDLQDPVGKAVWLTGKICLWVSDNAGVLLLSPRELLPFLTNGRRSFRLRFCSDGTGQQVSTDVGLENEGGSTVPFVASGRRE
jgi:hypothetical protein